MTATRPVRGGACAGGVAGRRGGGPETRGPRCGGSQPGIPGPAPPGPLRQHLFKGFLKVTWVSRLSFCTKLCEDRGSLCVSQLAHRRLSISVLSE